MATSLVLNQLASRLKNETASQHQQMHLLMEEAQVFADTQRYAKFTLA